MNEFNHYFSEQLQYIKSSIKEFATAHPNIAANLSGLTDKNQDPLFNLIFESFAFFAAKLQLSIEQSNNEILTDLFSVMFPQFNVSLPAFSILQIQPDVNLNSIVTIKKDTELTLNSQNNVGTFRVGFHTPILPFSIEKIIWLSHTHFAIHLKPNSEMTSAKLLHNKSIRFFINTTAEINCKLLNALKLDLVNISIDIDQKTNFPLSENCIAFPGFADSEHILPVEKNQYKGFNLLTEFVAYTDKFSFFDILIPDKIFNDSNDEFVLNFEFRQDLSDIKRFIDSQFLLMNCCPIINIFKQKSEIIEVIAAESEYAINVNYANDHLGIYCVNSIETMTTNDNTKKVQFQPYFSSHGYANDAIANCYWHVKKRDDNVFLVVSGFESISSGSSEKLYISLDLLCTNEQQHEKLFWQNENIDITLAEFDPNLFKNLILLKTPTPQQHFSKNVANGLDRLNLFYGHIKLFDEDNALENLKILLSNYLNFDKHWKLIIHKGISKVTVQIVMERIFQNQCHCFAQGFHYQIEIDEDYFNKYSYIIFSEILFKILQHNVSITNFVKLTVHSKQKGYIKTWQSKLGIQKRI